MKRLVIAAAAFSLGACAGSGSPEAELPDSTMYRAPADPAATPQPVPAESVTPAPARAPSSAPASAPTQPAQRADPNVRQPPPPRDTRPSIPWPQDTL